eukprot:1185862-Prorocentrum_minimum.AAC.1
MHLVGNTRIFLWVLDTGCKPEKCAGVRPIVLCVARPPVRPTKKFMVGRNKTTAISIGDGEDRCYKRLPKLNPSINGYAQLTKASFNLGSIIPSTFVLCCALAVLCCALLTICVLGVAVVRQQSSCGLEANGHSQIKGAPTAPPSTE